METNKLINVFYNQVKVGVLALSDDKKIYFQYDKDWLENGFSINPFSLPLKEGVFNSSKPYFEGLFGVFSDSLPDAWGKILLNRMLKQNKINIKDITVLDKLAIVGTSGMGALEYQPAYTLKQEIKTDLDFDSLSVECNKILNSEFSDSLDELFALGGSSGGARPKILTKINGEEWIIKFNTKTDGINQGKMEYDYYLCAIDCGINMMEAKLLPSKISEGYFATKRFDRGENKKVHMISVAALLELDFGAPSLDYHSLMKLTKILTNNNFYDIEQMFKVMCFNVFAHNLDDHSKNFSFIYNEVEKNYRLSPAYDLTYSNTYFGEHTTSIDGNGKNPAEENLLNVGIKAGMKKEKCREIINNIKTKVNNRLKEYLK